MAKPRQIATGKWELKVFHPSLPKGYRYFYFDTEDAASLYSKQWDAMKQAGIAPPAELLENKSETNVTLGAVVRAWANSGQPAPTQQHALSALMREVGAIRLMDADYKWAQSYVRRLKVENNLAPNTIRGRMNGLARSIDEYLRNNPQLKLGNPVRLLPKGYSIYSAVDKQFVEKANKSVREDIMRDRRLGPGEEERITQALSGHWPEGKYRPLPLRHGNAMLTMFKLIVNTGLRLKEAYMLRRGQVDMDRKFIRVQCSKQWRGKVAFREVPMPPAAYEALTEYLATRALLPLAYLFPFLDEDGGLTFKQASSRLSARFGTAFKYAGCPDLNEHDLRHEATCRWFEMRDERGNWIFRREEINRIMGWSDNSVMAQRYASFRGTDFADRIWSAHENNGEGRGRRTTA